MLAKKFDDFQALVRKQVKSFKRGHKLTEDEFDAFTEAIISNHGLDVADTVYCRDGFAGINEIGRNTFQILSFQINTFGPGIFSESIKKLCTPILLTVNVHGSPKFLGHNIRESSISVDEFYLGKHYTGSKGDLCKREEFMEYARRLYLEKPNVYSYNHHMAHLIETTNYICHHIAEVLGYAAGALNLYWMLGREMCFMVAGSRLNAEKRQLAIEIIEDYSGNKMSSSFKLPNYSLLPEDIKRFREEYSAMTLEVWCNQEVETYLLPVGYQKIQEKKHDKPVHVMTTQHILEHLLVDYYKRVNAFVVSNTFHTLEYLTRAMAARREGRIDEFVEFMKTATFCMGYFPDRDFNELAQRKIAQYREHKGELAHTMFFRAPILK